MHDFQGKLVLVTGGATGVGKAIVQAFVSRGAHVIVNFFHSLEKARQMQQEFEAQRKCIDLIRASVAQPTQVEEMFREIEEKYGYLDVLINNAASGGLVAVDEVTEHHLARCFNTGFKGSLWCSRLAVPLMRKRGGGAIVNISALGGSQLVVANYLACGPGKAAVEALTRYLAVEYAPDNIRVNAASGSMLESEVAHSFPQAEEMLQAIRASTPLGRLGTPEEFADVALFLASEQARWITGQVVIADGGLSLGSTLFSPRQQLSETASIASCLSSPADEPHIEQHERDMFTTEHPSQEPLQGASADNSDDDIVVVGMGLTVAGANNPEEFWHVMLEGPDLSSKESDYRWDNSLFYSADHQAEDKTYQQTVIFITGFKPTARLKQELGTEQDKHELTTLWTRHALMQALEGVKTYDNDRFSFIVGYTADGNQHLEEATVLVGTLEKLQSILEQMDGTLSTSAKTVLMEEIRATLEKRYWRGTQNPEHFLPYQVGRHAMAGILPENTELHMIDTACSSSLYAIDIGMKGLMMGKQDVAICGGAFALAPRDSVLFAKLRGLSARGEVRALDKDCDGVLFSDGAGIVVLKKRWRAVQDGDRILAVLRAFGSSSDGKGKAIYAPSSDGQTLAVQRALAQPGVHLENIDWIVAHATGTPAGDLAEFTTLRETIRTDHPVSVTSNKSIIGHTGWAAGVISVIEVLLGMQHSCIPQQFKFTAPPETFQIEQSSLRIPTTSLPWPARKHHTRTASVSGFGFGGTNGHLLLEEYKPEVQILSPSTVARHSNDRIAIVKWAAHFPGLSTNEEVQAWLAGRGHEPASSFGTFYPTPSFQKVRLPPKTVRTLDRCQLMILECAHNLRDQLTDLWETHRQKIGVFIGHMGATRTAVLYTNRCYQDDIARTLLSNAQLAQLRCMPNILHQLRQDVRELVPASNEDSFPGMMPNVIAARVANYFDLNGPNMTIDTGFSSALSAFEMASRYLRTGEVELALVGGINGNTTSEAAHIVRNLIAAPTFELAEGVCLFALTTETTAQQSGLSILGYIDDFILESQPPISPPTIHCGGSTQHVRNYLGAEGALAVLTSLLETPGQKIIQCQEGKEALTTTLKISVPDTGQLQNPETRHIPAQFAQTEEYAPAQALTVKRHVPVLEEFPAQIVRAEMPFLPENCLVLTDQPELLDTVQNIPADLAVLSVTPFAHNKERWIELTDVTPTTVETALAQLGTVLRHIRILTNLQTAAPTPDCLSTESKAMMALHDLGFLVVQRCFEHLRQGQSSFISLFLEAWPGGAQHPFLGFFRGLIQCAGLELPDCITYGLFTSTSDVLEGVQQVQLESRAQRYFPIVLYEQNIRKTLFLQEESGDLSADSPAFLDQNSVIVAVGGARGITAELLKAIAQHFQPHIYLIGSNRLNDYPAEVFVGSDAEFAKTRPNYIRTQKALYPEKNIALINKTFDRMLEARAARQNIDQLACYAPDARIHYYACGVTDRERLTQAVAEILQTEGKVDLLINAAGLNHSALIVEKNFANFCTIRDIKIRAYQNLKYAFQQQQPRIWCNFGSLIGFSGQIGEIDYASANGFLLSASSYENVVSGKDEFTIGWTLWSSVGLGANPLTRSFLEKAAGYSNMLSEEGIYHFIREINLPQHVPEIIHIGEAEKRSIQKHIPGFFDDRIKKAEGKDFYLDRVLSQNTDECVFERTFDLQRDSYLNHHLVNDYPTLPGSFVTEIMAEAAAKILPGMYVIAFEDMQFYRFLRVYDEKHQGSKHIHASIIERRDEQVIVKVRILTDILAPNGKTLQRDKVHFESNVVLAHKFPPAPFWEPWAAAEEILVPDPYYAAEAPVLLTNMFVSTEQTRLHPLGKRARYTLKLPADHATFSHFMMPTILLDGLARIGALNFVEEHYIPLAAPTSIRRIDIYEALNDCQIGQQYGSVELYMTPREFTLTSPGKTNRFVATRPDGKMIVQLKDVTGTLMGYIHRHTGQFVAPTYLNLVNQHQHSLAQA